MPHYTVNGTVSMGAWCVVEADSETEAIEEAQSRDIRSGWEYDEGTAEIDLNVEPAVTLG